jgi:3-oxoacyl-[acyl-carrier protein] reductase
MRLNAIVPGILPEVVTSVGARMGQTTEREKESVSLGRPGRPRGVRLLVLYLASAVSDYMIGQTILLDSRLAL